MYKLHVKNTKSLMVLKINPIVINIYVQLPKRNIFFGHAFYQVRFALWDNKTFDGPSSVH